MSNHKNTILDLVLEYSSAALEPKQFIPGKSPVPASGPLLLPEDVANVVSATLDFWYTDWKHCEVFRRKLCEYVGKKHCVLTNSGSSANLAAVTALCYKTNQRFVVTTALGFPTTVFPIYQNNKIPIFVDVDPLTLSPNWEQVERVWKEYGKDIAGFVFAHTLGFPFDEARVPKNPSYCYNQPFLVVDSCDALGSKIFIGDDEMFVGDNLVHVGHYADATTLSFFPAHQATSGEGGAVLTDNDALAEELNRVVGWGRSCYCLPGQSNVCGHRFDPKHFGFNNLPEGWDHKYTFVAPLGYNLKMTEWQAAMGSSQMNHIDEFVDARLSNFDYLSIELQDLTTHLAFINLASLSGKASPFGFPVFVKYGAPFTVQDLISYLEKHKISTRRVFGGNLTRQPVFSSLPYITSDLSNTDYVMERAFWIGCQPALTTDHLDYVIDVLHDFFYTRGLL